MKSYITKWLFFPIFVLACLSLIGGMGIAESDSMFVNESLELVFSKGQVGVNKGHPVYPADTDVVLKSLVPRNFTVKVNEETPVTGSGKEMDLSQYIKGKPGMYHVDILAKNDTSSLHQLYGFETK